MTSAELEKLLFDNMSTKVDIYIRNLSFKLKIGIYTRWNRPKDAGEIVYCYAMYHNLTSMMCYDYLINNWPVYREDYNNVKVTLDQDMELGWYINHSSFVNFENKYDNIVNIFKKLCENCELIIEKKDSRLIGLA